MGGKGAKTSKMENSRKKGDQNVGVLPRKLEREGLRLAPQRCDTHEVRNIRTRFARSKCKFAKKGEKWDRKKGQKRNRRRVTRSARPTLEEEEVYI